MRPTVNKLVQIYTSEKSIIRLLPFQSTINDYLFYLKDKFQAVEGLDTNVVTRLDYKSLDPLINELNEIETNRIKFFCKEYLRCRLDKIRKNPQVSTELLNPQEREFLERYLTILNANGLDFNHESPDVEYTGFIALRDMESVHLDGEMIDIKKGDFYIVNMDDVYDKWLDKSIKFV